MLQIFVLAPRLRANPNLHLCQRKPRSWTAMVSSELNQKAESNWIGARARIYSIRHVLVLASDLLPQFELHPLKLPEPLRQDHLLEITLQTHDSILGTFHIQAYQERRTGKNKKNCVVNIYIPRVYEIWFRVCKIHKPFLKVCKVLCVFMM